MDAEIINPFLAATINVIETMAAMKVTPQKPVLKQGNKSWGVVSGIIGIAGKDIHGNLVLSFDEPSILEIVDGMLGEKHETVTPDVIDAVGEITNMISGNAKAMLSEKGYAFEMATPMMMVGQGVEITQLSKEPVISLPFKTPGGSFVAEICMHRK